MNEPPSQTLKGDLFTRLILDTFRLNGLLLAAGDDLTRDLDLSSALWQVMGAIKDEPLHMAQIARNMGLTRQSVRRTAQVLAERGLVYFIDNPNHKRAKLVALTDTGKETLGRVGRIHTRWANGLAEELNAEDLSRTVRLLRTISDMLTKGEQS